jgi:hypothetical protein
MQILVPPDDTTLFASREATAAEEESIADSKQNKKQQGKMKNDAPKKCPKRDVPSQNPNAGWVALENLIAERLDVQWAELRYVPQFSQPLLLGPRRVTGACGQKHSILNTEDRFLNLPCSSLHADLRAACLG